MAYHHETTGKIKQQLWWQPWWQPWWQAGVVGARFLLCVGPWWQNAGPPGGYRPERPLFIGPSEVCSKNKAATLAPPAWPLCGVHKATKAPLSLHLGCYLGTKKKEQPKLLLLWSLCGVECLRTGVRFPAPLPLTWLQQTQAAPWLHHRCLPRSSPCWQASGWSVSMSHRNKLNASRWESGGPHT
jgi:hypothetical protein